MCCSTCGVVIERTLRKLPGIRSISVSYVLDMAYVEYDPRTISAEEIKSSIEKEGFSCIQRK